MPAAAPNHCPGQPSFLLEPGCAALDRSPFVHCRARPPGKATRHCELGHSRCSLCKTFLLLRGKGRKQEASERRRVRGAEGRGLRAARAAALRARRPAWGPVPARAAWKVAGCCCPAGGSAAATGPLREGGRAPLRLASAPRVRSRRSAGTRSRQVAGHWGRRDWEAGSLGLKAVAVRASSRCPEASQDAAGRAWKWVLVSLALWLRWVPG